jgi:2-polyprenyl-6-methoxyphenol hydroxylase-like FAD-dependent oxidoreductase
LTLPVAREQAACRNRGMADFDAIAVGGGLAGAAFALELARRGARVAVIERTGGPSLKVCGDFLSREAQELLAHLGLGTAALGAANIKALRLVTGERRATGSLPFATCGLSRLRLDEELLGKAQSAGAELIRGEAATALEPAGGNVRVRVGARTIEARCAALATGKHNLRGWPRGSGTMTAMKIQLSLTPTASAALDGIVQLVSYRGGYIGACNVEDGAATICWLLDERTMQELGPDWRAHLGHISRQSSAIGDLLAGARFHSQRPAAVSAIPYGYVRRTIIAPNVFPLGDQLCVIPSFTGDGTSLALSSGLGAARAVLAGQGAAAFQADFLARIRAQFLWARAVETTFRYAPARSFGVAAVALAPGLVGLIANLTRVRGIAGLTGEVAPV